MKLNKRIFTLILLTLSNLISVEHLSLPCATFSQSKEREGYLKHESPVAGEVLDGHVGNSCMQVAP